MKNTKIKIPRFKTTEEAAIFWENNNILNFYSEDEFKIVDPKKNKKYFYKKEVKKEKKLISIRIDSIIIDSAKNLSLKMHRPYQQILNEWLWQGLKKVS